MATVVTIERRVLQMDGGEFQKLCDAYLSAIGFGKPNAFGSKAGSNKVKKGTPDTFFERPNGKLVFAEYTTQQNNLKNKLFGDLDKCLNEGRARIPINRLEEIVFCFTSQLGPSEVLALRSKCEEKGIKLTLFGISALANDLVNHPYSANEKRCSSLPFSSRISQNLWIFGIRIPDISCLSKAFITGTSAS